MPGMKIKVPSGECRSKRRTAQYAKGITEKQQEHPFAKEKPKSKLDVEDIKPKEKPSVPYVPPVPNIGQSSLPEGDISNLYQSVNQLHQPYVPPKPYEHQEKGPNMYNPWTNEEENHMENVNYPNVPQPPNVGAAGDENKQFHGMPNVAAAGYHHHPYPYPFYPGGCWIPVSPVLPGSGLCHPWYPYPAQMPYMHQPSYVSPAEYDDDDNMGHDNAGHHGYHHQPMTAPAYAPYQPFRDLHRQTSVTPGTLIWHTAKKMTAGAGRANSRRFSRCGAIWTDAANGSSVRYGDTDSSLQGTDV